MNNMWKRSYKLIPVDKLRKQWKRSRKISRIVKNSACAVLSAILIFGGLATSALALTGPYEQASVVTAADRNGSEEPVLIEIPTLPARTAAETAEEMETASEQTATAPAETTAVTETEETSAEPLIEGTEPAENVEETTAAPEMTYAGEFLLTAYCSCSICCGKWAGGPTASGVMPTAGRTIAVDKKVIPLGTHVYIEGLGEFVAEDTGAVIKGNCIDVYMGSHTEAEWFADGAGSCRRKVWILADK